MDLTLPRPHHEWTGIALIVIGAFCFSTAILFVRLIDGMGALSIAFFRALMAFSFFGTLTIRFHAPLRVQTYRPYIGRLLVLGLATSLTVSLYTYSIQHTTAATAALLVNSSPIYVALLAPLLIHEPRARYTGISLALAVIGMICMADPTRLRPEWDSVDGIAAAALSGFTYSFVIISGRALRGRVDGFTQTLWSTGVTMLVLLPWALQSSGPVVIDNLPYLIPLGIFSLGLSYLCYFQGLQWVSAQIVSVVALFEPVSGVMIGLLFFQEIPSLLGALGGVLILGSIYLISK